METIDLAIFIANIVFSVVLLLTGIENPSIAKFFKDLGVVMLDYKASPVLKLQQIQNMWQQFALMWMSTVDEVQQIEKNLGKKIEPLE